MNVYFIMISYEKLTVKPRGPPRADRRTPAKRVTLMPRLPWRSIATRSLPDRPVYLHLLACRSRHGSGHGAKLMIIVVPFLAGASNDAIARSLAGARETPRTLGVVENNPAPRVWLARIWCEIARADGSIPAADCRPLS